MATSQEAQTSRRPRRWRRRTSERGFTLVEAMIASLVFTVGALGLLRMMYASSSGLAVASKLTLATRLATTRLEELTELPYADANLIVAPPEAPHNDGNFNLGPAGTPYDDNGVATGVRGCGVVNDGWFARSWTVAEPVAGAFKVVTVSVCWWDKAAKTSHNVSVAGGKSYQ